MDFFSLFQPIEENLEKNSADKILFHKIKSARNNDRGEPCLIIA